MSVEQSNLGRQEDNVETVSVGMYEAGGEAGSDFHVFNAAPDQYHRADVLQRTGAINITCDIEKVVHGAMADDSDRYATLMVMRWYFQPKGGRRISEATIELTFESVSGGIDDIEVEGISFQDTYSLMPTTQQESITKGGDASIGIEHLANLTLSGKWEKSINAQTSDAITLSGQRLLVNNLPPKRIATWTLSENQSQPTGIPAFLKVAVRISRQDQGKFFCRLAFTCKTDLRTAAESLFKKIPKDDPIIFQANPHDKGTLPNRNVLYGHNSLGSENLDELCDVTFRTTITNAQKTWK